MFLGDIGAIWSTLCGAIGPGKMRRIAVGFVLLGVFLLAIGCCGAIDDVAALEKLRAGEDDLDRMREKVEIQQQLVDGLAGLSTCEATDRECRRKPMQEVQAARRRENAFMRQIQDSLPMASRLKQAATFEAPRGATILAKFFLPFQENNALRDRKVNKYQIAVDSKGWLHIYDKTGVLISSNTTGHSGQIISMAVDSRMSHEYKIVTGSKDGEVRVFGLNAPKKPKNPVDPNYNSSAPGAITWEPEIVLQTSFYPATVETVRSVSSRHYQVQMNEEGKLPITAVDFVSKGRSYNVIVGDKAGRFSIHNRNGTATASARVEPGGSINAFYGFGTIHAIGHRGGVTFYETKERRLLSQKCLEITQMDDAHPHIKFVPRRNHTHNSTESPTSVHAQRATRPPPAPMQRHITSLAPDVASNLNIFAGTTNGTLITLQVRGEKSRVRCTVLHEIPLLTESLRHTREAASVSIAPLKGFLFVAASAPNVSPSLSVMNITSLGRASPPELALHIPLPPIRPWRPINIHSDRVAGVVMVGSGAGPKGGGLLFESHFPFVQVDTWEGYGFLQLLRHPLLLGAMGLMVMYNMRSSRPARVGRLGRRMGSYNSYEDKDHDPLGALEMMGHERQGFGGASTTSRYQNSPYASGGGYRPQSAR